MRRAYPLVLAVVVLAACGGSSGSYASKADAICRKYKQQAGAISPATLADLAKVSNQVLPLLHDARRELRALQPPADQTATANAWLAEFDVTIDDVKKIRDKAKAGDGAGVRAVAKPALQHNQRANRLAAQLGMKVCSKN